ncbi:hypothetical protein DFQ26_000875, partial [Actinomortierella ambigua]
MQKELRKGQILYVTLQPSNCKVTPAVVKLLCQAHDNMQKALEFEDAVKWLASFKGSDICQQLQSLALASTDPFKQTIGKLRFSQLMTLMGEDWIECSVIEEIFRIFALQYGDDNRRLFLLPDITFPGDTKIVIHPKTSDIFSIFHFDDHWAVLQFDIQNNRLYYGNSLGRSAPKDKISTIIQTVFNDSDSKQNWDKALQTMLETGTRLPIPKQPDESSCGVFAVAAIERFLTSNKKLKNIRAARKLRFHYLQAIMNAPAEENLVTDPMPSESSPGPQEHHWPNQDEADNATTVPDPRLNVRQQSSTQERSVDVNITDNTSSVGDVSDSEGDIGTSLDKADTMEVAEKILKSKKASPMQGVILEAVAKDVLDVPDSNMDDSRPRAGDDPKNSSSSAGDGGSSSDSESESETEPETGLENDDS